MKRRDFVTTALTLAAAAALPKAANAATNTEEGTAMSSPANRPASGYAPVNGVEIYYEIHGSGAPLILLHGGFGSIEMFGPGKVRVTAGGWRGVDERFHGAERRHPDGPAGADCAKKCGRGRSLVARRLPASGRPPGI